MNALIITTSAETKAVIQQLCGRRSPAIGIVRDMPGMLKLGSGVTLAQPDLIFFDAGAEQAEVLEDLTRLSAKYPKAAVVLLAPLQSPDLLIAAMRLGVREVVGLPLKPADLEAALDRMQSRLREVQREDGKVISIVSSKGGSGATFVATNLGYALATIAQKKTLLIDLNLQFGDAALYLSDMKPQMTMADLCAQISRLDEQLLHSSLIGVTPEFGVLAASPNPDPEDQVRPDHVASILALAKQHYDFILLDVGRQVNAVTIRALDGSDLIMPVLQQSLPFIRNGQRMLDMFSTLGYRKDSIRQILNRHDDAGTISVADMERGLGQRIAHPIPNNFEVVNESINQGEPVLKLARSSSVSKALIEIVRSLTEAPAPDTKSIIRRLFVRNSAVAN
jgi:pilus assembly protein CpaE